MFVRQPKPRLTFTGEVRTGWCQYADEAASKTGASTAEKAAGRGSGKSSFLEYLSFGLGRSCYDLERDHYSGTQRMHDLINDTLVSKGGRVALAIVQDNAAFEVVRGPASSYQPQITYPNGSVQTVTVKELRALFPAVVYSRPGSKVES